MDVLYFAWVRERIGRPRDTVDTGAATVRDLVEETGLAQSTVSAHMGCLRECGLVVGRTEGRQTFYALARPELLDLLATAETLLAATGSKVALCPTYGTTTEEDR